jgi:autotransporter-associated beta strand protein
MHISQPQYWLRGRVLVLVVLSTVFLAGSLSALVGRIEAAILTWDANPGTPGAQDGSGDWDTMTPNWISGGANVTWSAGNDAVFGAGGTGTATVTLTEPISTATVTFNAGATYTLAGNNLTLTGITANAPETIINAPIHVGATDSRPIAVNAESTLTIQGPLTVTGHLNKSGSGTLVLSGDNSANNRWMDVGAGVVSLRNSNGVPGSYFHVTTANAVVELAGGLDVPSNKTIYLSGGASSDALATLSSTGGDNVWNGNVILHSGLGNRNIGVAADSTLTIAGVLSGGAGQHVVKIGDGTLILSGANTYVGNTTIAAGTIRLADGANRLATGSMLTLGSASSGGILDLNGQSQTLGGLTLVGSGTNRIVNSNAANGSVSIKFDTDTTLAGVLGAPGQANFNFTKTGEGKLTLGANDYTGSTSVAGGTLELTAVNQLNAGTALTVAGSATLDMAGHNQAVGAVTLTDGTITGAPGAVLTGDSFAVSEGAIGVTLAGSAELVKSGSGTVTLGAATTYAGPTRINDGTLRLAGGDDTLNPNSELFITAGGVLDMDGNDQTFTYVNNNAGLIDTGGGMLTIDTRLQNTDIRNSSGSPTTVITGSGGLIKLGASHDISMGGPSDYTGGTYIREGAMRLYSKDDCLPVTGDVYIASGATLNLRLYDLPNNQQQTIDELSGAGTVQLRGAMFIIGNGNGTDGVNDFAGRITDGIWTGGGLTKVGTGTQILSGNSDYTGPTYINAGVLNIRHNNALGSTAGVTTVSSGAALEVENSITVGEALTISGGGIAETGALRSKSGNNVWNGAIEQNAAWIGVDAGTLTVNGRISGSGTLQKVGGGTLVLAGDNTYTGDTRVEAGALNIRHSNALGAAGGHTTVPSGAALELQGGITVDAGLTLSGSGIANAGALRNISGNNVWNGDVGVDAGWIAVDFDTLTINGRISGTGALGKAGSGTLVLSGDNTYTGPTAVEAGRVELRHGNALGTGAVNVASGAAVWVRDDIAVSTGTLTFSGGTPLRSVSGDNAWNTPIHVAGTTGSSVASQIQVDTDSTLALYGPLSRSEQVHLRKVGNGTLIIDADNTGFDRWMDVSGGVLSLRNADGFPGSYFNVTTASAVLELAGGITIPSTKIIYLTGGATSDTVATLYNASGDNVHNGTVVLHTGLGNRNIGVAPGTTLTLGGVVSGIDRNLVKIDEGTLILGADNTYTGTTRVAAGTLLVNGSLHGSSAVTVEDGGTLGGTGTIGGPTSIEAGGTLATGASVGTLTFGSDLTLAGGSIWDWEFIDATNYDQAVGTGGAKLILPTDTTTPITLNILGDAGGHWVKWYDEFTIFDGAVENFDAGLFDLVNHSDWAHGWQIFSDGQNLVLTAVPEPGALVLLTFGLLALLPRRKCR